MGSGSTAASTSMASGADGLDLDGLGLHLDGLHLDGLGRHGLDLDGLDGHRLGLCLLGHRFRGALGRDLDDGRGLDHVRGADHRLDLVVRQLDRSQVGRHVRRGGHVHCGIHRHRGRRRLFGGQVDGRPGHAGICAVHPAELRGGCMFGGVGSSRSRVGLGLTGHRRARQAAALGLVPAVGAGVLPAVHAEVEGLVEGLELRGGDRSLLVASRIGHGRLDRAAILHDPVLEAARQDARTSEPRPTSLGRGALEGVARATPLAERFGQELRSGRWDGMGPRDRGHSLPRGPRV